MPEFFREMLEDLTHDQKGELCQYICTSDDNEITTEIVSILDPSAL